MRYYLIVACGLLLAGSAASQDAPQQPDAQAQEFMKKIRALDWQFGPREVALAGNSRLSLPEGYAFLDAANTSKFEELNQNIPSGREVMIAPRSLRWSAYLIFDDGGYVKDDEKIDADKILSTLRSSTERTNEARRRKGYPELHIDGWNIPPAYNGQTKRLEWATLLHSDNGQASNFFTKILGRRGVTTVVLVSAPSETTASVADLDQVLTGYHFNSGDTYAEWRPGDKVAEYGLTGLIVGGAVAAAVKTGFWKVLLAGAAAFWKVIVGAGVAGLAALKSVFKRKSPSGV